LFCLIGFTCFLFWFLVGLFKPVRPTCSLWGLIFPLLFLCGSAFQFFFSRTV
jgi:hypothetical protein